MHKKIVQGHWFILVTLSCLQLLTFSSCGNSHNPQKKFKQIAPYYKALKSLDAFDEKETLRLFRDAKNHGSDLTKRKSAEYLTQLGNVQDRLEACKDLIKTYPDEEALITACTELEEMNEWNLIISYTENLDFTTGNNELIRLRLNAILEKKDSRFLDQFFYWSMCRPFSSSHAIMYAKYQQKLLSEKEDRESLENRIASLNREIPEEEILSPVDQLLAFRSKIYRRNYAVAYEEIDEIWTLASSSEYKEFTQLLSDMGKSALYGTMDSYTAARKFQRWKDQCVGEAKYFALFYAGRLYDKTGRFPTLAIENFKASMNAAMSDNQYDNSFWYLLNTQLRTSAEELRSSLKNYAGTWHDATYFDDFFESYATLLLSHHKWQDFYEIWQLIDSIASEETACKYAYISGRLLEEGLVNDGKGLPTKQAVAAFTRVLSGDAPLYYTVCALERLNILDKDVIESALCFGPNKSPVESNPEIEQLLGGYRVFGFPQNVYPDWYKYRSQIGTETALCLSQFLNECGEHENSYAVQSLRIASNTLSQASEKIPLQGLKLNFPRFFQPLIENWSQVYELDSSLIYALVRSESFFNVEANSSAGATGLTQLMGPTAGDIARKLKYDTYDLLDADTNIHFGTHYLRELINRTDNSPILAIFAYNSGLTNVRNWVRYTKREWTAQGRNSQSPAGMSMDLFLETLPFDETREYGRKIVGAAAVYGWLYENKNPGETVRALMR